MPEKSIKPSQLCIGLYIRIDLPWMQHSFMTNSFKIKNEKQLAELKSLGLRQIAYDPQRSDAEPLPLEERSSEPEEASAVLPERNQKMWEEKQGRIVKMKERRVRLNRCEKEYTKTVSSVRNVMRNLMSQPKAAVEEADEMVAEMVGNLMVDQETTVHLVNMKGKSEGTYYHAINVSILALMLGKQLGLDQAQLQQLGLGALFHDLGHNETPEKILRKSEPLSKAEEHVYRLHPQHGARSAVKIGTLPPESIEVILQHHEMLDGSGYPKGLKGDQISELAKIVAIVNAYDNLCNNLDPKKSCTPYEAMSLLYSKERQRYDEEKLTTFITKMGVYPPGTVVRLSNAAIAVVMSVNPDALLQPKVMVYDLQIPKTEALILDLKEEDVKVVESLRLSSLPQEVLEYLNLGETVNVYFDSSPGNK